MARKKREMKNLNSNFIFIIAFSNFTHPMPVREDRHGFRNDSKKTKDMKTTTLRSIAELNLTPLFRISKWGVASAAFAAAGCANMFNDWWVPCFFAAILLADRHIRWDGERHKKRAR